jgi:tRNA1(Val) A37 N6-methylase TrmN6
MMIPAILDCALTRDHLLGARLSLLQPAQGHRVGTDAVLLASEVRGDETSIADFGAASGAVGLMAALYAPKAKVTLIEQDPELCALARVNSVDNGLAARLSVLELDIMALKSQPDLRESFDLVLTNPPFFSAHHARPSPDAAKARAHRFGEDQSLDSWLRNVATTLKPSGILAMIHRADALETCLQACAGRFGAISLSFIYPQAGKDAIRCLIRGVKGSRAGLSVKPPIILHEKDGTFTKEVAALGAGARLEHVCL